jgi:hypothetical protein
MVFPLLVLLAAISVWLNYGRPRAGFLPDFAKLLDRPEFVDDLRNRLSGHTFLKGEFRGRKVVILLRPGRKSHPHMLVLSMETGAPMVMDSYEFAGYRADREGELALFALEAKHELVLRLRDGTLKALWQPFNVVFFPGVFDPKKWQSVLEAMHTLAGSLERKAASSSV